MDSEVIVVGAGLSGLMAARHLMEQDVSVLVVDKGRSVGGRMATRRIENGRADTGAQFFTVRTETFGDQVARWTAAGLLQIWGYGWSDGSLKRTHSDGHPRYVAKDGMNALMKHLAEPLLDHILVETTIETIAWRDGDWLVSDTSGNHYSASALLLTPPVPQSLDLLASAGITLTSDEQVNLKRIHYGPCLCGLFVVDGDVTLPDPGAVQDFEQTIYWFADNKRKGISEQCIITAHAEKRFSQQQFDAPADETLAIMRESLSPYLAEGATIVSEQLKKWRYSVPLTTYPEDCLVTENYPLVFAGDAFGGRGRVEGAFLSGLAAGKSMVRLLS